MEYLEQTELPKAKSRQDQGLACAVAIALRGFDFRRVPVRGWAARHSRCLRV
jgi:hypothetical protein